MHAWPLQPTEDSHMRRETNQQASPFPQMLPSQNVCQRQAPGVCSFYTIKLTLLPTPWKPQWIKNEGRAGFPGCMIVNKDKIVHFFLDFMLPLTTATPLLSLCLFPFRVHGRALGGGRPSAVMVSHSGWGHSSECGAEDARPTLAGQSQTKGSGCTGLYLWPLCHFYDG